MEVCNWFNAYLASPFDYLPNSRWFDRAICWFKPTAREHLERAWDLVAILERNDMFVWTITSAQVGKVYYEDDVQVFAQPYREMRRVLRR